MVGNWPSRRGIQMAVERSTGSVKVHTTCSSRLQLVLAVQWVRRSPSMMFSALKGAAAV